MEPTPTPEPQPQRIHRAYRTKRGANGGTTKLAPGQQWLAHEGTRARLRRHRQAWQRFEKLCASTPYAKVTRERLLDYAAGMNLEVRDAEIVAMSLCLRALCASEEHPGLTWTAALNQILNELEEAERAKVDPSVGVKLSTVTP